jgi:uroporphyrinogen-III synthase
MAAGQRPLAGRTIVVTRPRHQAAALASMIEDAGGRAVVFPLLEIEPATDLQPLQAAISARGSYDFAFFVSPNAVAYSVPAILACGAWPPALRPAAVGEGTARALAALGIGGTIVPSARFDSEALLALPALGEAEVRGRRAVIFRGDGGRELLADTLRQRGCAVDCVTCYRRLPPAGGARALNELWQQPGGVDAFAISSSEGLRNLVELLDETGRERLAHTPVFAPHERIVEAARALGLQAVATGAADAGLVAGLCAYNWPPNRRSAP